LRKKYGDEYEKKFGSKLSFLSVFVRAAISALQARPVINAVIDGNDIVYRDYIDVSVSVASASGIVRFLTVFKHNRSINQLM
jgi:2-oxoglutarate dehydrogenase E2 component (dihydrolipoamide succinyltransferase)